MEIKRKRVERIAYMGLQRFHRKNQNQNESQKISTLVGCEKEVQLYMMYSTLS